MPIYICIRVCTCLSVKCIFCCIFQTMKVQGLIVIFFGLTGSVIINENVIFQKTNDITVTHAKWLASFVIDLEPFNAFLAKLAEGIDTAAVTAECIINKYRDPEQKEYMSTFLRACLTINFSRDVRKGH